RVQRENASLIADLGCGAGNLTRTLAERWRGARVVGVDNSSEMLAQAKALAIPGRLDFVQADIASWMPDTPIDLLVSNAAFHWVDNHDTLFPRLAGMLSAGGTLAVQMPYHFQNPAHLIIEETKADPRWNAALKGVGLHQKSVMPLLWYVDRLHDLGFAVDAWETTYIHVLTDENPVLEWYKGSALRPLLKKLNPQQADRFLHELGDRFRAAYPAKGNVTLLPFPRLFFVATRRR
ncbi:MAG TPA: methyltransferase domain-containing protein, partial [Gemmataceae bacterium]|nr:methyltransferase domain-containing protein [Gemmataceae bacterium]